MIESNSGPNTILSRSRGHNMMPYPNKQRMEGIIFFIESLIPCLQQDHKL